MADDDDYIDGEEDDLISEPDTAELEEGAEKPVSKEGKAAQFLATHHPECRLDYKETVLLNLSLEAYPPDHGGDKKHKSVPYLTVFEKTKILGFRANQLAQGSKPFSTIQLQLIFTILFTLAMLNW